MKNLAIVEKREQYRPERGPQMLNAADAFAVQVLARACMHLFGADVWKSAIDKAAIEVASDS